MTEEEIEKKSLEEFPPCMVPITSFKKEDFEDEVGKELTDVTVDANKWLREAYKRGLTEGLSMREANEQD